MRRRPGSPVPADAVARRLSLLSAELAAVRGERAPADVVAAADDVAPEDRGDAPGQRDDGHTHVRPASARPVAARVAPDAPSRPSAAAISCDTREGEGEGAPAIPVPGRHAARRRTALFPFLDGRVALTPGHVAVVAVVALLGLALTTWWALRGEPEPVSAATGPALTTPVPVGTSAAPSTPAEVVVDVAGKVRRPGIAVLEPGARVVDAIRAAGGVRRGVDLSGLNLARVLMDGEQILVGVEPAPGVAASAAGSPAGGPGGSLVNLNTASATQLEELPGVGPVTAEAILAFRTEHGAFTSVDQLLDVSGIGEATLAEIAPHATLG